MRDYKYVSKETLRHNLNECALDAIGQVLWDTEILDETRKLYAIDGIMTLMATISEDMTEDEVKYDAQADD